ncbi:ciliary microtubule-associated protein 3 [Clinocottus analis]|uniref:ciliary microtubule-associated protein 3 n=1 Tax=Clinocottus analis TaxID=304258 RepID=UPI0035C07A75
MLPAPVQKVHFGSCQERKVFPDDVAPDRLGTETSRPQGPHVGPGCYDNHTFGTILYDVQKRPQSKKGYSLSARTAVRFPPCESATPSPQQYQQDQTQSRVSSPGKTPFNSTTQRFKIMSFMVDDNPGPGTYPQDAVTNRKVSRPMCFGSPDLSRPPQTEKKPFSLELNSEAALQKHRNRVAYMSLYF